jgi:hypothetical protein
MNPQEDPKSHSLGHSGRESGRTAIIDHDGKILPGVVEALGQENDVQIAKVAWLSRRDTAKVYGSMVLYATKAGDARRLLNDGFFYARGESGYTGIFERRMRPEQCYNYQQIGRKAFQCKNPQVCARCAKEGHHHGSCSELERCRRPLMPLHLLQGYEPFNEGHAQLVCMYATTITSI